MADQPDELPDAFDTRLDAFLARHAVPFPAYAPVLDRSIAFTAGAAEDSPPAGFGARWVPYGARNIGGRIRALAQHPDYPLVIYAGTGAGGIYKTSDGGDTWAPIGGPQAVFAVGALAISRKDPRVLYIGTGEPVVQHGVAPAGTVVAGVGFLQYPAGRGFFRFVEGAPLGHAEVGPSSNTPAGTAGAADSYARIADDPGSADRCWLASKTGLWRREAGPVFHREPVPPGAPNPPLAPALGAACTDVLAAAGWDKDHPKRVRLFAAFGALGIFRGVFDPDVAGSDARWDPMLAGGLPAPSTPAGITWDRIRLALCGAQPDHVYALAEMRGAAPRIYHSSDAGDHWTQCPLATAESDKIGPSIYYSAFIEVHPLNPAIVVAGCLNVLRSTDFGQHWELVLDQDQFNEGDHAQHADEHAALFDAGDPNRLWIGNDGGMSMAVDIVQGHPARDRGWRKRSHGIAAAMFNDITVHPNYPWMIGGGLQDNGTYVSFGGETWYEVGFGDGGQMAFEVADPRTFFAPSQGLGPNADGPGALRSFTTSAVTAAFTGPRAPLNADKAPPLDVFSTAQTVIEAGIVMATHKAPFVPVLEHHPSAAGRLLVGRKAGGTYFSVDAGANFNLCNYTALQIGGGDISALAYGNQPGDLADFWIGTDQGVVLRGNNAVPPFPLPGGTVWTVVTPTWTVPPPAGSPPGTPGVPMSTANSLITRIAVHPADDRYIACCASFGGARPQGLVLLSADSGQHWSEISALGPGFSNVAGSLPPGPCTSLAFDPQPAAGVAQTLYVGTLSGVYVIRNLPRRSPPAGAALGAFVPSWARFIGVPTGQPDGPAAMPMILVEDLAVVRLPAITAPGVVAGSPESLPRTRLLAATFGRGIYACDITRNRPPTVPVGGPPVRLYIRQTVVEDGLSYPRPAPATLNSGTVAGQPFRLGGDPRFPRVGVGFPVAFNDREAFDIRIDNAPFQFFDDVIDGVEFDQGLSSKPLAVGERNAVYVQVHTCGWQALPAAGLQVHLYFAACALPPNNPSADPVPDLHADFWAHWLDATLPAPAAPPVAPAVAWQRVGDAPVTLATLGPNQPAVARFDWVPPTALGPAVALLALVTSAPGVDPLVPAGQPTAMKTLLRNQRRAAFRVAPVTPFVPDLYIRDGLDDIGRAGGVAFGGRSPDILVVQSELPAPLLSGVASLVTDPRNSDRVATGDNFVYVRVLNRKAADTAVDVELFWAQANPPTSAAAAPTGPLSDNTKWQAVPAVGAVTNVNVPANSAVLVEFKFTARPAPVVDIANALAFIALIKSHGPGDPEPDRRRVTDPASVWRFFLQSADSNNAALRTVLYAA